MSTAPSESKAPRQRKKLQCHKLAEQIHNNVMFFMKRLTQHNSDIHHVLVNIDAMLTELGLLEFEIINKLGSYTVITENYMLENYDNCDKTSLTIIPGVMGTFKRLFDEFKIELFRIKHNYYSKYDKDVAITELQTLISNCLNNLQNLDDFLRIITNMKYEEYLQGQDEDTRPPLWGGRRSKGWRRKTKRRRNNKTKRRRNKSMRLH